MAEAGEGGPASMARSDNDGGEVEGVTRTCDWREEMEWEQRGAT